MPIFTPNIIWIFAQNEKKYGHFSKNFFFSLKARNKKIDFAYKAKEKIDLILILH
jgi:hypothetical protein